MMESTSQSTGAVPPTLQTTPPSPSPCPASSSFCEVAGDDDTDTPAAAAVESTQLISSSSENKIISAKPATLLASCEKCNKSNLKPVSSAWYSNSSSKIQNDKIVQFLHTPGRGGGPKMSLNSTSSPLNVRKLQHQNISVDEVVTCVNCKQRIDARNLLGCRVCKDYWGILLSLASGLASTFGGLIVRHMKHFHPFSLATYRFQGIVFPTLLIVSYYYFVRKQNVFQSIWPVKDKDKLMKFGFTIIRAVIGCFGLYLYFYSVKLMPLADAKVILSCRTVFIIFVAHFFLGEACGIFPVFAATLSIIGVGVISRPPILTGAETFDTDTSMGTLFATLSMLAATLSMVVLRYLRGVHVAVVTLAFGVWGTILSLVCSAAVERFDVPESINEWILITCLAISAFFSQTALTLAMKYEHAGAVVIVGTCDTIMSFILQYFILGDAPDTYSLLGATLIVICVSLITLRKWILTLPETHSSRKKLWFVLK